MKNLKIVLILAAFFATNIGSIAYSQDALLSCSTLVTGNDVPSNQNMECTATPTSLKFNIYELSLCTAAANPSNQASEGTNPCTKLHYDVFGEEIDLTGVGASIQLGSDVSLAEGTYTHALLKMDVDFSMTTKFQFAASRTADTTPQSSGEFCYSNGSDISGEPVSGASHITCSDAFPSTVEASTDSIKLLGEEATGFDMNQEIAISTTLGGVTSVTDLYILDSDGTQSSGDLTYNPSDGTPVLSGSSDRKYIMASQILASPVVISPSTSSVELGILVADSSSIGLDPSNGNIISNIFNGLIIQISAN